MRSLIISLIQTSLHWESAEANLQMFDQKIDAIREKTELIILPEMFNTGFSMQAAKLAETMDGKTVQWMKQKAAEKNIILTGSLIIKDGSHYFNRLLWVLPNGEIAQYDKRHLFSYAGEHQYYTPGKQRLIARVKGWKIGLFICYDLRFPIWLRQAKSENLWYDLLIIIANWPASRNTAWNCLLQARAIENQCYVAGVNRTGIDGRSIPYAGDSCIIDPLGKMITKEYEKEIIITHTLQKNKITSVRDQYPFLKDADGFKIIQ